MIVITLFFVYSKYFHPERIIHTTDQKLTSFEEIAWRISRTSFEFIPKDVKTTKSELNTTIPAITKEQVSEKTYEITSGTADVVQTKNTFTEKSFIVTSSYPLKFRLNTYNFPGWKATIDDEPLVINDLDDYKRISVNIPRGTRNLEFKFENTPVRIAGNWISVITLLLTISGLILSRRYKEELGY